MFRPRLIPVLLLRGEGLVKTRRFRQPQYLGDPMNAVRLFNEFRADELMFLDTRASLEGRTVDQALVAELSSEAQMPFSVGGGLRRLEDIQAVLAAGAEKVVLGTIAVENPRFIRDCAERFGSSTISVCIDFKKNFFRQTRVCSLASSRQSSYTPLDFARLMEDQGAGEVVLQSVDRDGEMCGYDLDLTERIAAELAIPTVGLGGAGSLDDLRALARRGCVNGLAAGSLFVFHGKARGVLLNYPDRSSLGSLLRAGP